MGAMDPLGVWGLSVGSGLAMGLRCPAAARGRARRGWQRRGGVLVRAGRCGRRRQAQNVVIAQLEALLHIVSPAVDPKLSISLLFGLFT